MSDAPLIGFCSTEGLDVPIGRDRACLTDGAYALAPSTGCAHQRWLAGGGWSVCVGEAERGQRKPCKPVAAGTWRSVLDQQERAVARRDADRVARRVRAESTQAPKLTNARKPVRGSKVTTKGMTVKGHRRQFVVCLDCGQEKVHGAQGRCDLCYRRGRRLAAGVKPSTRMAPIPCPACGTAVKPWLTKAGKRRKYCSNACYVQHRKRMAA